MLSSRYQRVVYRSVSLFLNLLLLSELISVSQAQENLWPVENSANTSSKMEIGKDICSLEPGQSIKNEIKGGESHYYQIHLSVGQFLRVEVDQKGTDLVLILLDLDNKQLIRIDTQERTQEPEQLFWVAETTTDYWLIVSPLEGKAKVGSYEVKLAMLRQATNQDIDLVAAQKLLVEGSQMQEQETAESQKKAIEKFLESLPLWQAAGERYWEAYTLFMIGLGYYQLGEHQQALDYYHQTLPLRQAIDDRLGEAVILNYLGRIYSDLGEYQQALDYYHQALALRRTLGDHIGEAYTLHLIGLVYYSLNEYKRALDYYYPALLLRRSVGIRVGEAYTLSAIGRVYSNLGEYQQALNYQQQALKLRRAVGDRTGEVYTLTYIGYIYKDLGDNQKALDYYYQALSLQRTLGNQKGEIGILLGIAKV
ncbi:MAG: tetratricopeptide repeat protein, partial [Acidobacteriota bacterium]